MSGLLQRQKTIESLRYQSFDIVVIGGGATGAGIAVDAASRGLRVALIEKHDFSSETSSRSTKLVHGGVRYLETAVKNLDPEQLELVRDALKERGNFLRNAPYLAHELPILTPVYSWWEAFYFWVGLKIYGWLAKDRNMHPTRFRSRKNTIKDYPMLDTKGLVGGLYYHDGQFDDSRMNVILIKTAHELGAQVLNYAEVTGFEKTDDRISGVFVKDSVKEEQFKMSARVVVNATGPFTDQIRWMDDSHAPQMLKASSGTHIIVGADYIPPGRGILIPKTKDGRVVFILPWQGKTLIGTTDNAASITENPKPSDADIDFILETVSPYYVKPPTKKEILSKWTGLRPLVFQQTQSTSKISRDHVIEMSDSGLLTIAGGKWTTYRKMAEELVDRAIQVGELIPLTDSQTEDMPVVGAHEYSHELYDTLEKEYKLSKPVAIHLANAYGDRAIQVAKIAQNDLGCLLHPRHPYIEAEVVYAVQEEFAVTVEDITHRRMRLGFIDDTAAKEVQPKVQEILKTLQ